MLVMRKIGSNRMNEAISISVARTWRGRMETRTCKLAQWSIGAFIIYDWFTVRYALTLPHVADT